MSISIVLVPLAIAAYGAWQASQSDDSATEPNVCRVETRMRDAGLLSGALSDTRALVTRHGSEVVAEWRGTRASFTRDEDGVWKVDFTGDVDLERALQIVQQVDRAYGRQVQQAVLARLRERAPSAGMNVISETIEDDDSVTMVLDLGTALK